MDYSSLILMERDAETGFVTKELGSYQVSVEAEYVKGFYVKGDTVYIKFDTNKDVEEWEYSGIYDVFNYSIFEEEGFKIEDVDDGYINEKLSLALELIHEAMEKAFNDIEGKEEEYK